MVEDDIDADTDAGVHAFIRPHASHLVSLAVLAIVVLGCAEQYEPLPADRVCLDTAYAVSNRVHACTGDAERATDAFDDFQARTRCKVKDVDVEPIAAYYDCPTKVVNTGCPQIEAIQATNDIGGYLALSPKCPLILEVVP